MRPSHTRKLVDELAAEIDSTTGAKGMGWLARMAVRFVVDRYPQPARTQVMCDFHGGLTKLLHIHRRPMPPDLELRPGSSDCDVNPIRYAKYLFLCDKCAEEFDKKHKGA